MSRLSEALWNVPFFTVRVPREGGSGARVSGALGASGAPAEKLAITGEIRRASATVKLGRSLIPTRPTEIEAASRRRMRCLCLDAAAFVDGFEDGAGYAINLLVS